MELSQYALFTVPINWLAWEIIIHFFSSRYIYFNGIALARKAHCQKLKSLRNSHMEATVMCLQTPEVKKWPVFPTPSYSKTGINTSPTFKPIRLWLQNWKKYNFDFRLWLRFLNTFISDSESVQIITPSDSNSGPWIYSTQTLKLEKMLLLSTPNSLLRLCIPAFKGT